MLDIRLERIKDAGSQDAFDNIQQEFRRQAILNFFWAFFEVSFPTGGTYSYTHGLGFKPKDYLITGVRTPAGETAYIDLDATDSTYASITVSGACTVRFLLGNLDTNSQV